MKSKRYIPSGFSHVGTAKTVVDRNSRVSVIALIECDACGTQIQSVSRSVGSHRQACPGVRPEDVALDARLAEAAAWEIEEPPSHTRHPICDDWPQHIHDALCFDDAMSPPITTTVEESAIPVLDR